MQIQHRWKDKQMGQNLSIFLDCARIFGLICIRFDNNDHASSKMQFLHTMLLGPVHKYKYISGWGLTFCIFHILHASWITDWTSSGANSSGLCKWILQKPFGNERYCLLQVPWGGNEWNIGMNVLITIIIGNMLNIFGYIFLLENHFLVSLLLLYK